MEQWTTEPPKAEMRKHEITVIDASSITRSERKQRRLNLMALLKDTNKVQSITEHLINGNYGYLYGRNIREKITDNRCDDRNKHRSMIREYIALLECQLAPKDVSYTWYKLTDNEKSRVNIAIEDAINNCE